MVIIWLMMVNNNLVGGWPTPLKNDGVKVSWDDDIPNWMEKSKRHETGNNERSMPSEIFLWWFFWGIYLGEDFEMSPFDQFILVP